MLFAKLRKQYYIGGHARHVMLLTFLSVYLDYVELICICQDQGWTKLPKGTTIQVTYNLETQLHVDGNNGGTSFGTSVGDHAGGKVFLSDAQGDEAWWNGKRSLPTEP